MKHHTKEMVSIERSSQFMQIKTQEDCYKLCVKTGTLYIKNARIDAQDIQQFSIQESPVSAEIFVKTHSLEWSLGYSQDKALLGRWAGQANALVYQNKRPMKRLYNAIRGFILND